MFDGLKKALDRDPDRKKVCPYLTVCGSMISVQHCSDYKSCKEYKELEKEFWDKGNSEKESWYNSRLILHSKSEGIAKALEVIDVFTNYTPEIHKLIDDSRK